MKLYKFLLIPILAIFVISCRPDSEGTAVFQVRLMDNPANYDEINIDILEVRVQSPNNGWITLNSQSGVYNILDYINGNDTLIANDQIPTGRVNQIRLVLGDNNSIVVDGQTHPLTIPSGAESGLKLNLHQDLQEGITYVFLLDFDAAKSVVQTGNGDYHLKPVIRIFAEGTDGAIRGTVLPQAASPVVYAITGNDTMSTYADPNGDFLIRALNAGTYSIHIAPVQPYQDSIITGVSVSEGNVTNIGIIELKN